MVIPPISATSSLVMDNSKDPNVVFGSQLISNTTITPYSDATQVRQQSLYSFIHVCTYTLGPQNGIMIIL